MQTKTGVISLLVLSDITCPWCYIGLIEIERACEAVARLGLTIQVEHRPFMLHPGMTEDFASDATVYLTAKLGPEKCAAAHIMVSARAKAVGIDINFNSIVVQTIRAHRLCRKAYKLGGEEKQRAFLHAIYKSHFTDCENIADFDVLSRIAEETGVMSKDEALEFLKSDECHEEVVQMAAEARRKGVSGVPFTVINGRWAVSGGQTSEVFVQIFEKLAAKGTAAAPPGMRSCDEEGDKIKTADGVSCCAPRNRDIFAT